MKKMFNAAIVLGFIIILGGAGGYENMSASLGTSFAIMLSGAVLMSFGMYGKEYYKRLCKVNAVKMNRRSTPILKQRKSFENNINKIGCKKQMKIV